MPRRVPKVDSPSPVDLLKVEMIPVGQPLAPQGVVIVAQSGAECVGVSAVSVVMEVCSDIDLRGEISHKAPSERCGCLWSVKRREHGVQVAVVTSYGCAVDG